MLIGVILVGVIIYLLVKKDHQSGNRNQADGGNDSGFGNQTPEEILKERLAKGEIDEETFENLMKKVK